MEVIKISPRGYCYGVVDALQIVRQVAKDLTHPRSWNRSPKGRLFSPLMAFLHL